MITIVYAQPEIPYVALASSGLRLARKVTWKSFWRFLTKYIFPVINFIIRLIGTKDLNLAEPGTDASVTQEVLTDYVFTPSSIRIWEWASVDVLR